MGGADAHLMEVVAESVSAADPRAQSCRRVPGSRQPISLEFGWIGSSEAELHRRLGPPSGSRGAWQLFFFQGKAAGPYRAPDSGVSEVVEYDVIAYVEARVEKEIVTALRAFHVTAY